MAREMAKLEKEIAELEKEIAERERLLCQMRNLYKKRNDMRHLKTFESFSANEEISFRGIAAGAMMALMTACHDGAVDGHSAEGYSGDMLVKRIEMGGGKHNYFIVHGQDESGKQVDFGTDNLTFNVGDSIHVDFGKEQAYPLDDKGNIGDFQ